MRNSLNSDSWRLKWSRWEFYAAIEHPAANLNSNEKSLISRQVDLPEI